MGSRLTDIEARITRLDERMGPREGETIQEWANRKEAEFMRFLRVDLLNPTDESMRLGEQAFAKSIAARAISVIEEIDQNAVHRGWYYHSAGAGGHSDDALARGAYPPSRPTARGSGRRP